MCHVSDSEYLDLGAQRTMLAWWNAALGSGPAEQCTSF